MCNVYQMWDVNQMYLMYLDQREDINQIHINQDIVIRIHQTQTQTFIEEIPDRTGIQIQEAMDVDVDVVKDPAEEEVQDVSNMIPENHLVTLFHPLEIPKWDVIY